MQQKYSIKDESYAFSMSIIQLYLHLKKQGEYELSKQILRSGTSIGANIVEAQDAQSKKDFLHKMSIALKEAKETQYWLKLLIDSKFLTSYSDTKSIQSKCDEIVAVGTKIIISTKKNIAK